MTIKPIEWTGNSVRLIDQTKIPYEYTTVEINTYKEMAAAIKDMIVRGAPAIGVSGAFGFALGARETTDINELEKIGEYLMVIIPSAITTSSSLWTGTLQPAIATISEYISTTFIQP